MNKTELYKKEIPHMIKSGYVDNIKKDVIRMHYDYYNENYSFDKFFKSMVSQKLDSFFDNYTFDRDCVWTLHINDKIEGSIFIDGGEDNSGAAHLLLFFVEKTYRGYGFGKELLNEAISFCKRNKFNIVYLRTFKDLNVARHLYEKNGFQLIEESLGNRWGREVLEQKFELIL